MTRIKKLGPYDMWPPLGYYKATVSIELDETTEKYRGGCERLGEVIIDRWFAEDVRITSNGIAKNVLGLAEPAIDVIVSKPYTKLGMGIRVQHLVLSDIAEQDFHHSVIRMLYEQETYLQYANTLLFIDLEAALMYRDKLDDELQENRTNYFELIEN